MSLLSPKYTCTRCRFMSDDLDTTIPCTSPNGHLWGPIGTVRKTGLDVVEQMHQNDVEQCSTKSKDAIYLQNALRDFLCSSIPDISKEMIDNTPGRFVRAFEEMIKGYKDNPQAILSTTFDVSYDQIIILKDIPFTSLCEHHLLIFNGTVDVGYLPGKVVGLSKLARLVDCLSQRLQVQERLTQEIAQAIETHLEAKGVAVVVKGEHSCISCRGVKKAGSTMVTSCMLGIMRDVLAARSEFLALCNANRT